MGFRVCTPFYKEIIHGNNSETLAFAKYTSSKVTDKRFYKFFFVPRQTFTVNCSKARRFVFILNTF